MMRFWLTKNEETIPMTWSGENLMLNMTWNFPVFVLTNEATVIYISRYPILRPGKIGSDNKKSNRIFGNKICQSERIMQAIGYQ